MIDARFDDIRQYHDREIPDAMRRIAQAEHFRVAAEYVFPELPVEQVRTMMRSITTVREFQERVMYFFIVQTIKRSMSSFTFNGVENIKKDESYLFVSNHRDIVMDSTLLQYILHDNGFETTDITFGANLMKGQMIIDIGKANKMFKVERASSSRQFIQQSRHLSDFMREEIVVHHRSVWIAQRNGRTKDGTDATDPGIIKMFCMSDTDEAKSLTNDIKSLNSLNIVPLAISYEWEPCDMMKAIELAKTDHGRYVKSEGEDLRSILHGILQQKGRVHLEICKPICLDNEPSLAGKTKNALYKEVAQIIDRAINAAYRLTANNYIAFDMRNNATTHLGTQYSAQQYDEFYRRMQTMMATVPHDADSEKVRKIFCDIYANPVANHVF